MKFYHESYDIIVNVPNQTTLKNFIIYLFEKQRKIH